jgi:hypothetical protein
VGGQRIFHDCGQREIWLQQNSQGNALAMKMEKEAMNQGNGCNL